MQTQGGDVDEDSKSDGTGDDYDHVCQSTPKHETETAIEDDTVPEEDYVCMSTTETGNTIQSSAFIDLNKEEREEFQVGNWNDLEEAAATQMELQFQNLSAGLGETEHQAVTSGKGELVTSNQERKAMLATARYPKRAVTQQKACIDVNMEEESGKDVYDFEDDSFDDKDFVPSPPKMGKVFSPSKPVVEISGQKKAGPAVKVTPVRTPPQIVKARRDPEVEESLRGVGGRTPDEAVSNTYGSFNKELLSTLVHKLAKSKQIELSKEPLKPGFFKSLVNAYGDVSNTDSCKLAPYKSHQYIMRKWREIFCTKKAMSKGGKFQADVHLFEDQNTRTPCRLCSDHPHREDPRDLLLQKLSDQVNAAQGRQDVVKAPPPTGEKSKAQAEKLSDQVNAAQGRRGAVKAQAEKEPCPDCGRLVSDMKRHQSENCRGNSKNLVECTQCKMSVLKRSLPEHLKGRFEKKTGKVLTQPCQGDEPKR